MNKELKELASALGWVEIYSKNPYMISFWKEDTKDCRVNVYFTKMTVTVQYQDNNPMETYKECTVSDFEAILNDA